MNLDELERLLRDSKAGTLETVSELIDESYYAMYNAAPELLALARAGERLAEYCVHKRTCVACFGSPLSDDECSCGLLSAFAAWKAARGDTT